MLLKNNQYIHRLYWYLLLLIAFSLPFGMLGDLYPEAQNLLYRLFVKTRWTSLAIAGLFLLTLLNRDTYKNMATVFKNQYFILVAGYFAVFLLGIIYSEQIQVAEQETLVRLGIILMAFTFGSYSRAFSQSEIKAIFWVFTISVLLASLFTFRKGFTFMMDSESGIPILQTSMILHRPYLGMYILLSIFFVLEELYANQDKQLEKLLFLLVIYFVGFLFLIQAKMALITLFFTILILGSHNLLMRGGRTTILLIYSVIFLLIFYYYPHLEGFMVKLWDIEFVDSHLQNPNIEVSEGARFRIWTCVQANIKGMVWGLGYGTGDAQQVLDQCYQSKQFAYESAYHLNAHNEFLQSLLRHGLPGLICMSALIFIPLYRGLSLRKYLHTSFFLIILFSSFSESILSRQAGSVFFAFFCAIFLFVKKE